MCASSSSDSPRAVRASRGNVSAGRQATGPLTLGPRSPPRASLVCSFDALCASTSRVLLRNPMGSAGVGKTTTLSAVRALPDNCNCVHLICCHRGHVSGILYMVGQDNNSTKNCNFIYGGTRFLTSKTFVLGPGTRMIL